MNSVLSAYSIIYMLSALVPLVAILFAWPRRSAPGAYWLLLLLLASAEWTITTAIGWANVDVSSRILSSKLSYLGASTAPVFLLFFALEYTGRVNKVSPAHVAQLLLLPIASAFAAATNDSHNLIWTSVTPRPEAPEILVYNHGPLYWLVTVYGLVITIAATVVLVGFALRTRRLYRDQSTAVITAAFIPWAAHIIYSASPDALIWFDPGMTVGISAAILTFSMLRFRLLDIVPVARDALIEQMPEGLLVLDPSGRVVDVNPAAHQLLRVTEQVLGKELAEAFEHWPDLASELTTLSPGGRFFVVSPWNTHLSVQTWLLGESDGHVVGTAALLSDVSTQVRAEKALDDARLQLGSLVGEIEQIELGLYGPPRRTPARRGL